MSDDDSDCYCPKCGRYAGECDHDGPHNAAAYDKREQRLGYETPAPAARECRHLLCRDKDGCQYVNDATDATAREECTCNEGCAVHDGASRAAACERHNPLTCPTCEALNEAEVAAAAAEATLGMTVLRLGGMVEGKPTLRVNFLQRIDELRRIEERCALLEKELAIAESFHKVAVKERDLEHHYVERWQKAYNDLLSEVKRITALIKDEKVGLDDYVAALGKKGKV